MASRTQIEGGKRTTRTVAPQAPVAAPKPLNRGGYSVASATSGLPMNQHIERYGGPGPTQSYQQQTGGGGYGGGGDIGGMMAPMSAPAMTEGDYLNSDDVYLAALSRYNKQYEDLLADVTRREGDYKTTYDNSLEDLGYLSAPQGGQGNWDFQNQQTAAGRGFQSLIQDFAARGLLHSGDYLGAQNDFVSQLGKQLESMNLAKQQFGEGLNQERTSGASSRDAGIGQARAEALARYAQIYGAV